MKRQYYTYDEALEKAETFVIDTGIRELCSEICKGGCCEGCGDTYEKDNGACCKKLSCTLFLCYSLAELVLTPAERKKYILLRNWIYELEEEMVYDIPDGEITTIRNPYFVTSAVVNKAFRPNIKIEKAKFDSLFKFNGKRIAGKITKIHNLLHQVIQAKKARGQL